MPAPKASKNAYKAQKGASKRSNWQQAEFVQFEMQAQHKKEFEAWMEKDVPDTTEMLAWLIDLGYRVSMKWHNDNSCYFCTVTGADTGHIHHNYLLTSRAGDVHTAICVSVWKVNHLGLDVPWPLQADRDDSPYA